MSTAPVEPTVLPEIYQPDAQVGELKLYRPPQEVLTDAKLAADALQQVIDGSLIKPVSFGASKHLRHEHWATLGHFFGYCTKIDSTKYVEFGQVRGFQAVALLLNERTGAVVGRVEAMCLDEEENWGEVAAYEWQNGHKIEVGTKTKPLFQLQSMAETRASGKAYRLKLSWIAVLAGYNPTPAEEVHEPSMRQEVVDEFPTEVKRKAPQSQAPAPRQTAPVQQKPLTPAYEPASAAATRAQTRRPSEVEPSITDGQARRFYALWKQSGKTKAMVTDYLIEKFGIKDDREIPRSRYTEACAWAERPERTR